MKAKKSLGQNFINDGELISRIVDASGITADDVVLEIGPGRGALTGLLAERAKRVIAVELDSDLIAPLRAMFITSHKVDIVNDDILKYEIPKDVTAIIGNLPYYITTPIILGLYEKGISCDMTFMVQKEVAERIAAKPGGKDYGVLSVSVQYYAEPYMAFEVGAEYFNPRPKVDSAIVCLKSKQNRELSENEEKEFFDMVKKAFSQRRKTLQNCLTGYKSFNKERTADVLAAVQIDPARRPETLSQSELINLYREYKIRG